MQTGVTTLAWNAAAASSAQCHHVQCPDQRLYKGQAARAGTGALRGNGATTCRARRSILQRLDRCLRQAQAAIAGL